MTTAAKAGQKGKARSLPPGGRSDVATRRQETSMLYDNIMVPFDGSASAHAALDEAIRFAKDDPGAALVIVQILDTEKLVIAKLEAAGRRRDSVTSDELHTLYDEAVDDADKKLHRQIDGKLKDLMNKITVELLEETVPGEQIVTYAAEHDCDLVVMGSRGLGAIRGIIGSVSSYVLREADVPVLIVKEGTNE